MDHHHFHVTILSFAVIKSMLKPQCEAEPEWEKNDKEAENNINSCFYLLCVGSCF